MKVDKSKVLIIQARNLKGRVDFLEAGIPEPTYARIMAGRNCKPVTIGRFARALGCDVLDIIDTKAE